MDDRLKAKLLANDEISLEIEEFEQREGQKKGLDALERGFRSFYKNPDEYEKAVEYGLIDFLYFSFLAINSHTIAYIRVDLEEFDHNGKCLKNLS